MADSLLSRQGLGDGGADQVLEHCVETREERKRANNNVGYGVPRYYSVGRSGSSSGGDTRCKHKRLNIPLILSYFFFSGKIALYTLLSQVEVDSTFSHIVSVLAHIRVTHF